MPNRRHIADQAVSLPTKPPIPICILDEVVDRRVNDGQLGVWIGVYCLLEESVEQQSAAV